MIARLYRDTGFNVIDIPDSSRFFEREGVEPWKTFNNVNILQINGISVLTLEVEEQDARAVDYVILVDTNTSIDKNMSCYTVDGFTMQAPGVCSFRLIEDSFNTLGGFDPFYPQIYPCGNQIVAGSANRLSVPVEEDNNTFFEGEEPFAPANPDELALKEIDDLPDTTKKVVLIEVTGIPAAVASLLMQPGETYTDPTTGIEYYWKPDEGIEATKVTYGRKTSHISGILKKVADTASSVVATLDSWETLLSRICGSTAITLNRPNGNLITIDRTNTRWFMIDETHNIEQTLAGRTYNLLTDLQEQDMIECVIGYWEVPKCWIQDNYVVNDPQYNVTDETKFGIDSIQNEIYEGTIEVPKPTSVSIKNNKAAYGQSVSLKVFSPASGENLTKQVYDVTTDKPNVDTYEVPWKAMADIRNNGTPFFMFEYVQHHSQLECPLEFIKGSTWREISVRASGYPGSAIEQMKMNQASLNSILGAAFGAVGAGKLGMAKESAEWLTNKMVPVHEDVTMDDFFGGGTEMKKASSLNYYNAAVPYMKNTAAAGAAYTAGGVSLWRIAQQNSILSQRAVSAGSNIQIGNSSYLRDVNMNTFFQAICYYSDADMKSFDEFLTKFGYNVGNKPISNKDLYSRKYFNFVRINDLTVKSVGGNLNLINRTINQLKNGVRIWHKPVSYTAFQDNSAPNPLYEEAMNNGS